MSAVLMLLCLLLTIIPAERVHAATYPYSVFPADPLPTFTYKEHNIVQPGSPNLRIVPVTGQSFTSALEMTTPAGFQLPEDESAAYQITVQAPTTASVAQNDALEAKFWLLLYP